MLTNFLVVALATLAAAVPSPAAAVNPPADQVYLNAIAYGGTGCPQGTVGSFISADRQTFVPQYPNLGIC